MRDFGQYILTISFILSGLFFQSCNTESELDLDIISEKWNLISIENNGSVIEKENKDYFRDNAYVLIFDTDSTFSLNTSANYAGGKYIISDLSKISIFSYHEFTEVATLDENEQLLTDKLIQEIPKVYEYKIQNEKLTLITDNGNITFKVQ
jgi:hypothetical protein